MYIYMYTLSSEYLFKKKKNMYAKPIVFILGIVMIMEFPLSLSVSSYIDQMSLICNAHTY